jgi:uncharacterized Fe-S cluster protein YjdI
MVYIPFFFHRFNKFLLMSAIKEYSNDDITILWEPEKCIHSANCVKGLPAVFSPKSRPWINMKGAMSQAITDQVGRCPSGALSIKAGKKEEVIGSETIVEVTENGPMLVFGNLTVKDKKGILAKKTKVTAFCRCGASENKPYCDGSHTRINFTG